VRELGLAVSAHVLHGGGLQQTSRVEHVGEGGGDAGKDLAVGNGILFGLHDERLAGHGLGAHRAQALGHSQSGAR
jgi:hypothetical protein